MQNTLSLIAALFMTLACSLHLACGEPGDVEDDGWRVLHTGRLASVEAERKLYEREGDPHFYIHIRVRNVSNRPVGVDLREYRKVIYPNQWGPLDEGRRGEINERRVVHKPLEKAQREQLIADFQDGKLTQIAAGKSVDYYREFNASGRADVDQQTAGHHFVFISLDGEQITTDGQTVEQFACEWKDKAEDVITELILPAPVAWKSLPKESVIVAY